MEYLIKLSPDKVINDSASTYRSYYSIPKSRRFVVAGQSSKADHNWTVIGPGSLAGLTAQDELIIVAHGSSTECGDFSPSQLCMHLNDWGLKEVGRVSLKACSVGRGDYLDIFMAKARVWKMKIGEAKAYRGTAVTMPGWPIKPYEMIKNVDSLGVKSGSSRYKVVRNPLANAAVARA